MPCGSLCLTGPDHGSLGSSSPVPFSSCCTLLSHSYSTRQAVTAEFACECASGVLAIVFYGRNAWVCLPAYWGQYCASVTAVALILQPPVQVVSAPHW